MQEIKPNTEKTVRVVSECVECNDYKVSVAKVPPALEDRVAKDTKGRVREHQRVVHGQTTHSSTYSELDS